MVILNMKTEKKSIIYTHTRSWEGGEVKCLLC